MAEDLTMLSWRPRAGQLDALITWMRTRSGNGSSEFGGSTSSAQMTGPTSTSEQAEQPALPPSSLCSCPAPSDPVQASGGSHFPWSLRHFCNKPDDYFDIS